MTAKAWWTSLSSCAIVISNFDPCILRALFYIISNWVRALVLLDGGVSDSCVRDLLLCADADVWNVDIWFLVLCLSLAFIDCSSLGTAGVENVGNWVFGCVIDHVCRVLLLLVYSGTLDLDGLLVFVEGVVAIGVFCCTTRSVVLIIWLISLYRLTWPKYFIALAQFAISAITLSTCVMEGLVSFLWLKWIVSVKRSLFVDFMWHLCVR